MTRPHPRGEAGFFFSGRSPRWRRPPWSPTSSGSGARSPARSQRAPSAAAGDATFKAVAYNSKNVCRGRNAIRHRASPHLFPRHLLVNAMNLGVELLKKVCLDREHAFLTLVRSHTRSPSFTNWWRVRGYSLPKAAYVRVFAEIEVIYRRGRRSYGAVRRRLRGRVESNCQIGPPLPHVLSARSSNASGRSSIWAHSSRPRRVSGTFPPKISRPRRP